MSDKITTIEEALKFLKAIHGFSVMSRSTDNKWYNLVDDNHIGCLLEEKDNNVTFQMCFSTFYGEFRYVTLHVSHLGSASRCAYDRVKALRDAADEKHLLDPHN